MRIAYIADYLNEIEIQEIATHDSKLAVVGVALIFVYVAMHLRSALLALAALLQVGLSLPVAYVLQQALFGVQWTSVLNGLALFVVLGIAVDDCLVFADCFAQTRRTRAAAAGGGGAEDEDDARAAARSRRLWRAVDAALIAARYEPDAPRALALLGDVLNDLRQHAEARRAWAAAGGCFRAKSSSPWRLDAFCPAECDGVFEHGPRRSSLLPRRPVAASHGLARLGPLVRTRWSAASAAQSLGSASSARLVLRDQT